MPYAEIAFKIVNQVLAVTPGMVISISGEIHNLPAQKTGEPLEELPFIEELALAVRRKKAFPVLELSTDNLKRRFFSEMPDEIFSLPLNYYSQWAKTIDVFIDLGWRNNPATYGCLPDEKYLKMQDSTRDITEIFLKEQKKILILGFPTQSMANFFNLDRETLKKAYFLGINCDYNQLAKIGREFSKRIKSLSKIEISTGAFSFYGELEQNTLSKYFGLQEKRPAVSLPSGKLEIALAPQTLNGEFLAETVYYEQNCFNNVLFNFSAGKIVKVETDEDSKKAGMLVAQLLHYDLTPILTFGLNASLKVKCGYPLYDECIHGYFTLKFDDRKQKTVYLANSNVLLNKEIF